MRSGRSSDGTPLPKGAQALIRTLVDAGVTTCFTNPGTSATTELYFENCRIPGDRIIGEPGTGFKTALATLDHTRPTIAAQAVGIAQGALDAAIAYTKERKQFGKPISDFECMMRYAKITEIYEGANQIQRS